jgi:hypothetical protein
MRLLLLLPMLLSAEPSTCGRNIIGGDSIDRAFLTVLGRGDLLWETAEYIVDGELLVVLSKSPISCKDPAIEYSIFHPDVWHDKLRFLQEELDAAGERLTRRRLLMITQSPGGTSCGWRLLPAGGTGWSSVTEMKRTRRMGTCDGVVNGLSLAAASRDVVSLVQRTLTKPKALAPCSATSTDAGQ